jgi:hypothetical protein
MGCQGWGFEGAGQALPPLATSAAQGVRARCTPRSPPPTRPDHPPAPPPPQLRGRALEVMGRALDAGQQAAGGGGAALVAALEAAEASAAEAAGAGSEARGGGAMDVDGPPPLGAALRAGLRGVVEHEPSAALKAAAGECLKRLE